MDGGVLLASAVLGTLSQKTSTLMSPTVVWSVTDMADGCFGDCRLWATGNALVLVGRETVYVRCGCGKYRS